MKTILIIEVNFSTDLAVIDNLNSDYKVLRVKTYNDAIDIFKQNSIHLALANVLTLDWESVKFVLFIQKYYKESKYIFITASGIDDYISFAFQYGIYNILPRSSFLKSNLINVAVRKILSGEIFGIKKYFPQIQKENCNVNLDFSFIENNSIHYIKVQNKEETDLIFKKLLNLCSENTLKISICQVLEELTSNIYSHLNNENSYDYYLGYGVVDDKIILVIEDNHGSLDKDIILNQFKRNISINANTGLPESIDDYDGRGLYICHKMSDHLIFNIAKNYKTEIIAIFSEFDQSFYKSLSIYEV